MGMFDTVYVAQSLIEKAIEGTDIVLEPHRGYCDFQTKDLDKCLLYFYLEEDGSFYEKKEDQEWVEPDPEKTFPNNLPYPVPVGNPKMVLDTRTATIKFYDIYYTEEDRVWVEFEMSVSCGKILAPIQIKEHKKTNLEQEAIETKKARVKYEKMYSSWQWKLADNISTTRRKFQLLFSPITSALNKIDEYLRDKAQQKYIKNEI